MARAARRKEKGRKLQNIGRRRQARHTQGAIAISGLVKYFCYYVAFTKQSPLVWFAAQRAANHTFPPLHKGGFAPGALCSTVLRNVIKH